MTDILLDDVDGTFLTLTARVVKHAASDFMLDNADRRRGGGEFRRALVHDQADGLTVNFAGDYPGGVTITGPLFTSGPVSLNGVKEVTPQGDRLVVHGDISYETTGLAISASAATTLGSHLSPRPTPQPRTTVVLSTEIKAIHALIQALTDRVAMLEKRFP